MKEEIKKLLKKAVSEFQQESEAGFDVPEIVVEHAKDEQFGDYTTNIAMVLGKSLKKNPMEIAERIAKYLEIQSLNIEIKVVKPGYINFYLSPKYFQDKVQEINKLENKFGDSKIGKNIKVNNEFISANPTGPLHLGNGRGGFYGDTITQVLRKAGYIVTSEYYVNDAGEQTEKLRHSFLKDEQAVYEGDYIEELRKKYDVIETSALQLSAAVFNDYIRPTIADKMKIKFDEIVYEKKDLVDGGYIDRAIEMLKEKRLTFENEGALWLKTTAFGDDKDRVLVKGDGQKTYFASDCGYILYKMERGFEKMIEIWGADHHGYINRFKAAAQALGFNPPAGGELKFLIVQLVRLVKDGKEVRMSKRAGNVVYIDDLISEVGHDVARFFFLMYSPDTHMNFDLGLAKEQSQKNPVFYVQYAHARVCNILEKAKGVKLKVQSTKLELLADPKEINLIRELDKFPELVEELARNYEVHKLPHYALKIADKFHSFYDACRVIDEENPELAGARLELVNAVRIVLGETLRLIGVSAPNKM